MSSSYAVGILVGLMIQIQAYYQIPTNKKFAKSLLWRIVWAIRICSLNNVECTVSKYQPIIAKSYLFIAKTRCITTHTLVKFWSAWYCPNKINVNLWQLKRCYTIVNFSMTTLFSFYLIIGPALRLQNNDYTKMW